MLVAEWLANEDQNRSGIWSWNNGSSLALVKYDDMIRLLTIKYKLNIRNRTKS